MLAIWSLIPLPFLKPAWTSGSSQFVYCWSLAWRILSITEWAPILWPPDAKSWLIWKDPDAGKVLHSLSQEIWKTKQWPQDWRRSVFILIPKKGNAKECSNYHTIALISHASKIMLKILQARLQQYVNRELPDVQAGFRKGRGTRDQIANIRWIIEKARVPEKHWFLLYWLCQNLWLCGSQYTVENSERDGKNDDSIIMTSSWGLSS